MNKFLILGSGISGSTAGLELAELGHNVELVESGSLFGGKVLDYCCKATDECSKCGVCVAHTHIHNAVTHPSVHLTTGATVDSVTNTGNKVTLQIERKNPVIDYRTCTGCGECVDVCPQNCITEYRRGEIVQYGIDYNACLLHQGEECHACVNACPHGAVEAKGPATKLTLTGDGVLVATGHDPFPAAKKPRYGYERLRKVFTGVEAEQLLTHQDYLTAKDEDVAFIQCVGSRDPQIGRNYCSAVCCSYALRIARMLKYRNPDASVTIYYIDIQNFDKNFTRFRRQLVDMGVRFVRGVPFKVEELKSGRLKVLREDPDASSSGEGESIVEHDAVVLSIGLGPMENAEEVAEQFGLNRNAFGFFTSETQNVFVSGTCKAPMSIPESITAAKATALEMGKYAHE